MNQATIHTKVRRTSIVRPLSPKLSFRCHFQLRHIPCHRWKAAASFQTLVDRKEEEGKGKEEGIKCQKEREKEKMENEEKESWAYGKKSCKEEKEWQD
jgi:hypothetical protein